MRKNKFSLDRHDHHHQSNENSNESPTFGDDDDTSDSISLSSHTSSSSLKFLYSVNSLSDNDNNNNSSVNHNGNGVQGGGGGGSRSSSISSCNSNNINYGQYGRMPKSPNFPRISYGQNQQRSRVSTSNFTAEDTQLSIHGTSLSSPSLTPSVKPLSYVQKMAQIFENMNEINNCNNSNNNYNTINRFIKSQQQNISKSCSKESLRSITPVKDDEYEPEPVHTEKQHIFTRKTVIKRKSITPPAAPSVNSSRSNSIISGEIIPEIINEDSCNVETDTTEPIEVTDDIENTAPDDDMPTTESHFGETTTQHQELAEEPVEAKNITIIPLEDSDNDYSDSFDSQTEDEFEDEHDKSHLQVPRPDSLASTTSISSQVPNIILEILENEENYIKVLSNGIDGYIKIFTERNLPVTLRGQKYNIFGNIERIRDFHMLDFYPALQTCGDDVEKICNTFCKFIQEDYFYYYVLYAINQRKSERLCEINKEHFKERQNEIGDRLGINSFLVQPIQRLPKYQLLLTQLIKELGKNLEIPGVKEQIGACCKAERSVSRLLTTVNESMCVNDIIECNDINILHQGKFQKVDVIDAFELETKRKYRGKIFLFDKCVIHSEILDEKRLHFRGYYPQDTTGIAFDEAKNKFILYITRRGIQEVEFTSDFNTYQNWTKLLTALLMKTIELEKKKIEEKRSQRFSKADLGAVNTVIVRTNSPSSIYSSGYGSNPWTSGTSGSSRESNSSRGSGESNKTTWDERKTVERLVNSEKHYVQLMKNAQDKYLNNLSEIDREILLNFIKSMNQILYIHSKMIYPVLKNCDFDIHSICTALKEHLERKVFNCYFEHGAYANYTTNFLKRLHNQADIDDFINMPMKHLNNYNKLMLRIIQEIKIKDNINETVSEEFRLAAMVEAKMQLLYRTYMEHYNLNSMKSASNCISRDFGLIICSESVTTDGTKSRLLLLENALCSVKVKIDSKNMSEKFTEPIFLVPINAAGILEKKSYPKRITVLPNYARTRYVILFANTNAKDRMVEHIAFQRTL